MEVFSKEDIKYAASLGITKEDLVKQWQRIQQGFPKVVLDRPALIKDGIISFTDEEKERYTKLFEANKGDFNILKFTPASGAASRMFAPMRKLQNESTSEEAIDVLNNLTSFPFYNDLLQKVKSKGQNIDELIKDPIKLADFCLSKEGMDFDRIPKGLVTFYRDNDQAYNAFDLHCEEANEICDGRVHFTVSDEYLAEIKSQLANDTCTFSIQHPSTHFIASYKGEPLRNDNNNIIFRPSGHGALLKNLEELDADILLIKNIDNIQAPLLNTISIKVKKVLLGFVMKLKEEIDTFLLQLMHDENADLLQIKNWINTTIDAEFEYSKKQDLIDFLNRPIRIAGMVLNEGKVGGGPFWVKNKYGTHLQIIESAQINIEDPKQKEIMQSSTHFNPVELVCCLRDYEGNKFDLSKFVDDESGFLSLKHVAGKNATIMERPGLWNGSMANWLSLFVEIPLESFTPVKSIFDLLPKEVLNP